MSFPLPPTGLDCNLLFEFFWKFSAFEYALKREGFLKKNISTNTRRPANTGSPNAEADWNAFAKYIGGRFQAGGSPTFVESLARMKRLSPKRQVINENGELDWEPNPKRPHQSEAAYTLHLLRTVRNNLFHGGKYPDPCGPVSDIARNQEILLAALEILDRCYELHPGIRDRIDEIAA